MRTRLLCGLAVVLLLGLVSCSRNNPEVIRVISPLPSGTVAQTGVLQFAFSRRIVPPESTNVWLTVPYVEFTPAIEGKFIWQDTSRLVFSPDAPLPGDMKFKGKFNTALLVNTARAKSFGGTEEFSFATQRFIMASAEFFYDRIDAKRSVGIRANLEFTYAVKPDEAAKCLRITLDDQPVTTFKMMSTSPSKVLAVEIAAVMQQGKEREIAVKLDESLVSPETKTTLQMEKPFVFKLPELEDLQIYGHEFGIEGQEGWIRFKASQEVDPASVKQNLEMSPVRNYTVQIESNSSFRIRGNFEPGSTFHVKLKTGLESILGAKLTNEYETDIVLGNVTPSYTFASAFGSYMLLSGSRQVEVKTVNVQTLNVRISQIFQNNIVHFLNQGRGYDYEYSESEDGDYTTRRKMRYTLGNYGRVLSTTQLTPAKATNLETTSSIDLTPYLTTGYKGIFLVEISNNEHSWRWDSKLVALSDLGIIVKRSAHELLAFVVSLEDNRPVSGAVVNLISTNNQVMGSAKTDGDGLAKFYNIDELSLNFTVKMVTAEQGDDFNFINLADNRIETSRFDVDGKREGSVQFDAFLYGDRNLYRPGEKIRLSGIVRNLNNPLPANLPVKVKVTNPRGNDVTELQQKLNEQGSFECSYTTAESAPTGEYTFTLNTGDGVFLASRSVSVEEFVPDRLKVNVTASRPTAVRGDKVSFNVLALNFFGPPATNKKFEFEATFEHLPFDSKKFPGYNFSDDDAASFSPQPVVEEGQTDKDGKGSVTYTIPQDAASSGVLSLRGRIGVFDETGRPVYQSARVIVHPKPYHLGVRSHIDYYVQPHTPLKIKIAAVDASDKPIDKFPAQVEVLRREWHSVLRMNPGNSALRYVSEQREILVEQHAVELAGGAGEYSFSVPRSGDYVVRVSKAGDKGYNQIWFYAYSWGTTDITSFEINPEARVEIVMDKKIYAPGEKAKLLFQTPFNGRVLVTIERNRIFSYKYLEVENNSASMEIPIEDEYLPNAYVSAVLFRKLKDKNIPLMSGHGFVPLAVERPSNRLAIGIEAPEKIRPRTKQLVTLNLSGEKNVFVTLAAVDEGICQVKNYRTPDPYAHFYTKKALETETFDFFRDLIPEARKGKSSTGGSDDEGRASRVNPLSVKRFKPVALWSGIVRTDDGGRAAITLDVPDFSGELRLMALAYKNDRFGSAQKGMKVADPVVLSPALPRFLSPGDVITMPVTVFNTTDKAVSLKIEFVTEGPVTAAQNSASLDVPANQEKFVAVTLRASDQIGKAVVKVRTRALGEQVESVTEIAVRPVSPFVTESSSGFAEAGKPVSYDLADLFLPYGRKGYVVLSPFPVANFAKELKYLVGYPHGCLEQTTSKAFPQIYLRDIAQLLDPSILEKGSPSYFVNEAILKISGMQMHDGSFSYWAGGDHSHPWSTVYATHFLVEAKKAGYAVNDAVINGALGYLKTVAREKETFQYYYYENNRVLAKQIANKEALYALYVLALGGQPDVALMNFYRTSRSLLTMDTQYLLAGAFALSGDRKACTELLPQKFEMEEAKRTSGGCFDSPIRANAIILNILEETDPNNVNIQRYMEYLAKAYERHYWYTTQENAFTLLAFGKAARMSGGGRLKGTITVGGKEIAYDGGNKKIQLDAVSGKVTIALQGEGRLYYSVVQEGIRKDGRVRIEDKNLKVRRQFFDRFGNPVNPDGIKQNSLVIVRLTVQSDLDEIENVAVTDLLPAGFEIENPRLTDTGTYPFIKEKNTPMYVDIRDDRINYYTNFDGDRTKNFFYMVRAVTRGEFTYAPVVAEAMYDPEYYSASGGGKVRIVE